MKRFLILIIVLSIFCSFGAHAKKDDGFLSCSDNAGMLSDALERYMHTKNELLSEQTGARIIVATADETDEMSVNEYARELYDSLGISNIGRNNSVFIFLCRAEKDYCLIVSDGISAALTEADAQRYLVEHMEADFEKGSYDKAVIKTFNAFGSWYAQKYRADIEFTEDLTEYKTIVKTEKTRRKIKKTAIVLAVTIFLVVSLTALIKRRRKKRLELLRKKRQERRKRYMQIR